MKTTSASKLSRTKNWRVLIYGKPGVGKTSSVKNLTGRTLVLSLDNSQRVLSGLPNVDVWQDPVFPDDDTEHSFDRNHPNDSITKFIKDQEEIEANYDNLVIDNVSSFERDWFVERGRASKNGVGNEIQDYGQWTNYFARIITTIYLFHGLNVLVTAWETTNDVTGETGQSFSQYAPEIRDSVRDGFLGLTNVVGRVLINAKTGGRGVILEGNDTIFAKNQLDNRKACAIEDLFKFGVEKPGGEASDIHTPPVPAGTGKSSKTETGTGK